MACLLLVLALGLLVGGCAGLIGGRVDRHHARRGSVYDLPRPQSSLSLWWGYWEPGDNVIIAIAVASGRGMRRMVRSLTISLRQR